MVLFFMRQEVGIFGSDELRRLKEAFGEMREEIDRMIRENAQLKQELAETRRRSREERKEMVLSLLPAVDAMERLFSGVEDEELKRTGFYRSSWTVYRLLQARLRNLGVEEIEARSGDKVNPLYHRVVETRKGEEGVILEVLKRGYLFEGDVLREAEVVAGERGDG